MRLSLSGFSIRLLSKIPSSHILPLVSVVSPFSKSLFFAAHSGQPFAVHFSKTPWTPMSNSSLRTIFHVDMDAFFVSVEELFDPSLKGRPVVVGGQRDERGVVAAASYGAGKFGGHWGMRCRTGAKLCPQALFVNGHPERYREYSKKAYEVLCRFSPKVEMASI